MRIGNREFDFVNKSYIMGILNVTPDSFSDGGRYEGPEAALEHARKMISEGAAIIDVGGESTRPGHEEVDAEDELERVIPVIELLKKETDAVISLDTWKYQVAAEGIRAGADLINDIWGLRIDQGKMASLIAETGAACCLMHNRESTEYDNFLEDFREEMEESLQIAAAAGIKKDRIIIDPGIGFGKTYEQNLILMKNLSLMNQWKLPVLLGTSRKSMIGLALELPVNEREEGTLATTVIGRMAGVRLFRVHNVKANHRALRMTDAILDI